MASVASSLSDDEASDRQREQEDQKSDGPNSSGGGDDLNHQSASERLLNADEAHATHLAGVQEKETSEVADQHDSSAGPPLIHDWWLWETLSIVLSLAATAAIIIILAVYDGHELPSWPYKITLNTIISLLSTIAKVGAFYADSTFAVC